MKKYLAVGVAAFTLVSGAALAQQNTETSTTTRSSPSTSSYGEEKSQRTVDAQGMETNKSKSYESDSSGARAKSSAQARAPDGSAVGLSHERATTPEGDETVSTQTKTQNPNLPE